MSYSRRKISMLKPSHVLFFLCGAAVMLGLNSLRGSNAQPPRHVYELRLYHVIEGKMDALKARFGDHTDAIFRRHNMKSIGYWSPEDAPDSQNLFIYILEHPSRQEAEKNWAAFQADPEWKKVKTESEANGPLVDHIDRYFMDPTSFSALH
jgi:NIPSNAP protein